MVGLCHSDNLSRTIWGPFQNAHPEVIWRGTKKIYHESAPCDMVMADVHASTADGRVNELFEICRDVESGHREHLSQDEKGGDVI